MRLYLKRKTNFRRKIFFKKGERFLFHFFEAFGILEGFFEYEIMINFFEKKQDLNHTHIIKLIQNIMDLEIKNKIVKKKEKKSITTNYQYFI